MLANNEQARQLWEEKLKDLQKQNDKLDGALKEKDRQLVELKSQIQLTAQKHETTIIEKESQIKEALQRIGQL